ncbi:MAG: hypothetical protein LPK14_14470 [Hymenobacteraceae bacterium]|nr:hypothetical protein [Hymenobacteraceae bacterium]
MHLFHDYLAYGIDSHKKLLHSKWTRPISHTELREGLQHLVEVIYNHEIKLWLHHSMVLDTLSMQDLNWLKEVLSLLLVQSSLKQMAIVSDEESDQKRVGESLREKSYRIFGKGVLVEFFPNTGLATAWLLPHLVNYRLPRIDDAAAQRTGF